MVLGVEVIGDVTATAEVSHIETAGPNQRRRIQGALLADGVNCFFAALAMSLPVTTFAQNNGVSAPAFSRGLFVVEAIFCSGLLYLLWSRTSFGKSKHSREVF